MLLSRSNRLADSVPDISYGVWLAEALGDAFGVGGSYIGSGAAAFSVGGGVTLLLYAIYRRDPVFIAGQALGLLVYLRNLYFIIVNGRQASATE